jgi:hypothetical protein
VVDHPLLLWIGHDATVGAGRRAQQAVVHAIMRPRGYDAVTAGTERPGRRAGCRPRSARPAPPA